MPIDVALLQKKLSILDRHLSAIEHMEFEEDAFVANMDIHDLVVFRLQQAVETCIDIATHLIAQLGIPRKETAKDAFLLLGQEKILPEDLSLRMGKAVDFRNRVVHGYNDFDFRLLFRDYRDDGNDLRSFGAAILAFLEKHQKNG